MTVLVLLLGWLAWRQCYFCYGGKTMNLVGHGSRKSNKISGGRDETMQRLQNWSIKICGRLCWSSQKFQAALAKFDYSLNGVRLGVGELREVPKITEMATRRLGGQSGRNRLIQYCSHSIHQSVAARVESCRKSIPQSFVQQHRKQYILSRLHC
ncbi:hypothetical protein BKA66DRAFT_73931 [Pyrenochaeta sp. MPI-SDFR-AT-0127]|nr:hypothetical protein BKA66DRAFT_73931 [Pyrenochaeta sp. MPI-SDFR-AT-0127]